MSEAPTYRPGERVRVTLDATVKHVRVDAPAEMFLTSGGLDDDGQLVVIPLDWPGIRVSRLTPADGEPRAGQIWADQDGRELWAVDSRRVTGRDAVHLYDVNGRSEHWGDVHQGPLGPIALIRDVPLPINEEPDSEQVDA